MVHWRGLIGLRIALEQRLEAIEDRDVLALVADALQPHLPD